MKKISLWILALSLAASLAGCQGKDDTKPNTTTETSTETSTEASTPSERQEETAEGKTLLAHEHMDMAQSLQVIALPDVQKIRRDDTLYAMGDDASTVLGESGAWELKEIKVEKLTYDNAQSKNPMERSLSYFLLPDLRLHQEDAGWVDIEEDPPTPLYSEAASIFNALKGELHFVEKTEEGLEKYAGTFPGKDLLERDPAFFSYRTEEESVEVQALLQPEGEAHILNRLLVLGKRGDQSTSIKELALLKTDKNYIEIPPSLAKTLIRRGYKFNQGEQK